MKTKTVIFTLFLFFILGCSKDEIFKLEDNISNYDNDVKLFTQLIAAGMNDSEFRLFLKNKAVEQFDGDYDILVASSLDNKII